LASEKAKDSNKKNKKNSGPEPAQTAEESTDIPGEKATQEQGVNELKEQLASEKDRLLRLSAEFENYKKRKQRETDDFKKFANESIFRQLLTVVDNLERAILSAEETAADEKILLEGVKLTHKELLKLFENYNVKLVEAENQPFNPNFHQAVTQEETDEIDENTVTKVLQNGYTLHDRLIRPAMVIVSKKIQKEANEI